MTRKMIDITFNNAIAQARKLESCADSMVRISNTNLPNVKAQLQAAWEGDCAAAYIDKMDLTAGNIQKTANRLYEIAGTIREVAAIFRNSELKALEIATNRNY
ncbi:MAG: WXG100 family type VII secretion target [Oscillospiraceae bacterium]|nr:WXG100 family type VII secretion target [Oscillospiraceae bacterium]